MTARRSRVIDVPGIGKVTLEKLSPEEAQARVHATIRDLIAHGGNHRPPRPGRGLREDWVSWVGVAYTKCMACGKALGAGREQARGLHTEGDCERIYRAATTGHAGGGS